MGITKEQVMKALDSLEANLEVETVSKASADDLDQPEGADLGNPAKEKMSGMVSKKKAVKKAEDEISEKSEDGEEDEGEDMEKTAKGKVCKSFEEDMPQEIQTKIDVSEFLKSLVDHTGDVIKSLSESVAKSNLAHEARYGALAETVEDVQQSQAKIGVVLKAICERIGVIENAPARVSKAETVEKSEPTDRKFSSGLGEEGGEEKVFKSLSENPVIAKSQIANALCEMVKKSEATDLDVIGFESQGYIRPELVGKLKTFLN